MLSVRCPLPLILLVWLLPLAMPIGQCTRADPPEKVNTVKKALEGVVLFTATIPRESAASGPVSLSLRLKNLGKELLVFDDSSLDTFLLKVRRKDGAVVPKTRYLEDLLKPGKIGRPPDVARKVIIELAPGREAGVTLPLNRFFDLSQDGEYVVSIEARYTVNRIPGKIAIENLPFTIRHVPFDRITTVK